MSNRVKTIEVTQEYVKHFNERNLHVLSQMIDPVDAVFTRQEQPTIVGKKIILNRTHRLFKRLEQHGQTLKMVNAIIDLPDMNATPCMIGVLDGEKFSVCILQVKPNGLINMLTILLNSKTVERARATEPDVLKAALNAEKPLDRKALELRAKALRKKEMKLKRRIQKEGNTPALAGKMMRLENAREKLAYELKKFAS